MPASGDTLPHDEDYIDVRVDSGETVRVRRRTLMLRDAFSIQSKSTPKVLSAGSEAQEEPISSTDDPIELGGSADALKWLTGLLEATPLEELGMSEKDTLSAPPSIRPLQEAIGLADKLDIPFYKDLVVRAMYTIAKQGKYQAISSYNIGCALGDIHLARSAVAGMVGLPTPLKFSRTELEDMSVIAWCMLHEAWRRCPSFSPDHLIPQSGFVSWKSTQTQWLEVANQLKFEA